MKLQSFSRALSAIILMGLMALGSGHAAQAQSIYGASGLFLNPTADFPKKGQITPSALEMQQRRELTHDKLTWTTYGVDYGLTEKWEIGATYVKINPKTPRFQDGSFGLYAKYRVLEELHNKRPALAIGLTGSGGGDANTRSAFGVLRYTVTRPGASHALRLHLGALYIDEMDGVSHRELAPYGGVDLALAHNLTAFAETRARLDKGKDGTLGTFTAKSVGLAWTPVANYKLVLAYGSNGWTDAHSHLGVGVGYSIGGGR